MRMDHGALCLELFVHVFDDPSGPEEESTSQLKRLLAVAQIQVHGCLDHLPAPHIRTGASLAMIAFCFTSFVL
jgi:hypothetical protein